MYEECNSLIDKDENDLEFIDRTKLLSIKQIEYYDHVDYIRIIKYIGRIKKWNVEDYKYGSSGGDMKSVNKTIMKLNKILVKYSVKVV